MRNYTEYKGFSLICDKHDEPLTGRWVAGEDGRLYLSIVSCKKCLQEAEDKGYTEGVEDR